LRVCLTQGLYHLIEENTALHWLYQGALPFRSAKQKRKNLNWCIAVLKW